MEKAGSSARSTSNTSLSTEASLRTQEQTSQKTEQPVKAVVSKTPSGRMVKKQADSESNSRLFKFFYLLALPILAPLKAISSFFIRTTVADRPNTLSPYTEEFGAYAQKKEGVHRRRTEEAELYSKSYLEELAADERINQTFSDDCEFNYDAAKHKNATLFLGKHGSAKTTVMNGRAGKMLAPVDGEKYEPVPFEVHGDKFMEIQPLSFQTSDRGQGWEPKLGTSDLPAKIAEAKECNLCVSFLTNRISGSGEEKLFLFLLRHLPKDDNGNPDVSKLKIYLTSANIAANGFSYTATGSSVREMVASRKRQFVEKFNELAEVYGVRLREDQFVLSGKKGKKVVEYTLNDFSNAIIED